MPILSSFGQILHASPQVIMIELFGRGSFERTYLATLGIYARHYMADCTIFSSGIHSLENQQDGPFILCI